MRGKRRKKIDRNLCPNLVLSRIFNPISLGIRGALFLPAVAYRGQVTSALRAIKPNRFHHCDLPRTASTNESEFPVVLLWGFASSPGPCLLSLCHRRISQKGVNTPLSPDTLVKIDLGPPNTLIKSYSPRLYIFVGAEAKVRI